MAFLFFLMCDENGKWLFTAPKAQSLLLEEKLSPKVTDEA